MVNSNDDDNKIDLGLEDLLKELAPRNSSESISASSEKRAKANIENQESDLIDPKILLLKSNLESSQLPTAILVPQLIDILSSPTVGYLNSSEKNILLLCIKNLLIKLTELPDITLATVIIEKVQKLTWIDIGSFEFVECFNKFLVVSKDDTDPQILKARLFIHNLIDSLQSKNSLNFSQKVVTPLSNEVTSVDRIYKYKNETLIRVVLVLTLFVPILFLLYWFKSSTNELATISDSMTLNVSDQTYPREQKLVEGFERQDVSDLGAIAYEASNQAPASVVPQINQPTVAAVAEHKPTIDTTSPVEPPKVERIINDLKGSSYDRDQIVEKDNKDTKDSYPEKDKSRRGISETGVRYEILINTSVMDKPSFNSREVEELYVGDRVRVEERLGRWLKVRSRDGKPGYIMGQDAEKLFE